MGTIAGVILKPLKQIYQDTGFVYHVLKRSDPEFHDFGEVYFSSILGFAVKNWRKHHKMTVNLAVPCGRVAVALVDLGEDGRKKGEMKIELSPENYCLLSIPPGVWFALKGMSNGLNLMVDVATLEHDPDEAESLPYENNLISYRY